VDAGSHRLDISHVFGSWVSAGQRKCRCWDPRLASRGRGMTSDAGVRFLCLEFLLSPRISHGIHKVKPLCGRAACNRGLDVAL